ncbi:MAG: MBL fold metallo-hydrolase [Candidatus Solibacter usitatus]|nr:MBL fold metallo-hydrolase [Candidatus Solibacter usitatus]
MSAFTFSLASLLLITLSLSGLRAQSATFYFVDIGHGNVTFVVSPSGETMLLDCGGPPQTVNRIARFVEQNNIKKIDYMVISHFENDHMGAAAELSKRIPIHHWVDHGESVTYNKSDEWWKLRRGPWARAGMGLQDNANFDRYKAARSTGKHIVVKAGDKVPVKGLDVVVVTAEGEPIAKPLPGAGQPNPACANTPVLAEDDAEDGQSVGVVAGLGKFKFAYLGDLSWQPSRRLFCPENKVGNVDAYLVTHHAQVMTSELGDYYAGLSCCSAAEVKGLNPRVAFVSMGSQGHKFGTGDAMKRVMEVVGNDLWQTEKIVGGGEAGLNGPDDQLANIGGPPQEKVPYIKMEARADGSFQVTNSRNGFSKSYPAR